MNLSVVSELPSFRIDLDNLCLWRKSDTGTDTRIDLTPKAFDVLRYLFEHSGRLVTHDELLSALWSGVHVQPEVVKSHILAIRGILGDKAASPRYVETQRGRGYRFIGTMDQLLTQKQNREVARPLSLFAGRAEPLMQLSAMLEKARAGQGHAVFICGELGIGKTALVEQFLSKTPANSKLVVASGHCIEGFAGPEPYYPVLEALRALYKSDEKASVARTLATFAPTWHALIPEHAPVQQRPTTDRTIAKSRLIREACDLFEGIAADRPLVLLLEDLHWADLATIDFISALCRRRTSAQLLLVGTYRSDHLEGNRSALEQVVRDLVLRRHCVEIELDPLSEEETAALLSAVDNPEPEFVGFIRRHTGGNPLFVRETLEFLVQRGTVKRTAGGWQPLASMKSLSSAMPPNLQKLISTRLERMPAEWRRVLEAASVAGLTFDPTTVAGAAGMDEQSFEAICEELVRNTPIVHRGEVLKHPNGATARGYAFHHALYRHVLYDGVGHLRRTGLNLALAQRLEAIYPQNARDEIAARLAQHFALAGDWPRALAYLRSVLRIATSRFAWRDALTVVDQALELAGNLPEAARSSLEAEFLERRGALQTAAHDPNAPEVYAELAHRAGRHGNVDAEWQALIGLANAVSRYDVSNSLKLFDDALALSQQQTDPIQRDVAEVSVRARRLWISGWDAEEARACQKTLDRLKACPDPLAIARAQINFSIPCLLSTRYREVKDLADSAERCLREAAPGVATLEQTTADWVRLIGIPWASAMLGELGAALGDIDARITGFEQAANSAAAAFLRVFRGVFLCHLLDFEGALKDCEPFAARPRENVGGRILPMTHRMALIACGLAKAGLGDTGGALEDLRAAESEMDRQPVHLDWYWRLMLEWGWVGGLLSSGDLPGANARAERLSDLAVRTDERTWQALACEARGRVALASGKSQDAIGYLASGLAIPASIPLASWRVHATSAASFRANGDPALAATHTKFGLAAKSMLAASLAENHPSRLRFESRSSPFFNA